MVLQNGYVSFHSKVLFGAGAALGVYRFDEHTRAWATQTQRENRDRCRHIPR